MDKGVPMGSLVQFDGTRTHYQPFLDGNPLTSAHSIFESADKWMCKGYVIVITLALRPALGILVTLRQVAELGS